MEFYRVSFWADASEADYLDKHYNYAIYEDRECQNLLKTYNGSTVVSAPARDFVCGKTVFLDNLGKLEKNHTYYIKIYDATASAYHFKLEMTKDDYADNAADAIVSGKVK